MKFLLYYYAKVLHSRALTHIAKAKGLLHPELTSFGKPRYARSYKCVSDCLSLHPPDLRSVLVRAQMLSELEEVITHKGISWATKR
jgi:hypothetical protein